MDLVRATIDKREELGSRRSVSWATVGRKEVLGSVINGHDEATRNLRR